MDIMSDDSSKSFHTAKEGSPPPGKKRKAAIHADPDAHNGQDAPTGLRSSQRRVQRLPYELRDHIRVFLEERMYGEAVQLLTSLLAAGGSNQRYGARASTVSPLWIPPPSHLAVLATLAVHPAYTSRPQEGNDVRVAGHALQYLRHILAVAGPVQADMASAFQFRDPQGRPVGRARLAKRTNGGTTLSRRSSGRNSGRNSGKSSARNSLGVGLGGNGNSNSNASAVGSTDASAAGSRSQSVRPRRRLFAQSARSSLNGGVSSDYVDSGSISFDDNGDDLVKAVHAAADKMAVDAYQGKHNNDDDARGNDSLAEEDDEAVGGRMATKDSVWVRGQDFWHVVAWIMACSVNEPARWRCWQPWLALVVDVLEDDFAERLEAAHSGSAGSVDNDILYDSLLFQYLDSGNGNSNNTQLRRIAQAILSDGTQPASLVREVFDKETVSAGPQSAAAQAAKPARALDLDNDKFGDYSDDDESAPPTPDSSRSMSPTPFSRGGGKPQKQKQPRKDPSASSDGLDQNEGFLESLPLRQRLLYLVMLGSVYLPSDFASSDSVYRTVTEVLREADIFVFSSFVAAPLPAMPAGLAAVSASVLSTSPDATQVPKPDGIFAGLVRHILFTYLPTTAPKPFLIDSEACESTTLSVTFVSARILERCFLPFAANTAMLGANVRMALSLESLFRLAWGSDTSAGDAQYIWTPALQAAAEAGVKAREARVQPTGRNKHAATEIEALGKDMLQRSGRRLLAMVHLAKMDAEA
ncbi:major facilitator superfamily transporter [Ophiostoma piceae UAMH 11346]|uniref:Major facilitator superfamily transporter n=1 Tax=Ophiostoma piceae (strain UAMH 11346) TaxID=1262450 RepID=S3DB77_OPHP1|nr:major facilitator superfamily transporter [Ophiostoma piceae UAMH 11346]